MDQAIIQRIQSELDALASEEDVCILYACESGSRAWGFESADSDYDVRFIYLHQPTWYLRVMPGREVIERPIDGSLDVSGWDLRKALQLLRKSNPPLMEWLTSPIIYREVPAAVVVLRRIAPAFYSPAACHYHYLHMAEGNYREYLRGQDVWLKKYFYVLRPVLACRWIEQGLGIVPMAFDALVERVVDDASLVATIRDLVARKKAGEELDRGPRIPAISDFLDAEIVRLTAKATPSATPSATDLLDGAFVECLTQVYGDRIVGPDAGIPGHVWPGSPPWGVGGRPIP